MINPGPTRINIRVPVPNVSKADRYDIAVIPPNISVIVRMIELNIDKAAIDLLTSVMKKLSGFIALLLY